MNVLKDGIIHLTLTRIIILEERIFLLSQAFGKQSKGNSMSLNHNVLATHRRVLLGYVLGLCLWNCSR